MAQPEKGNLPFTGFAGRLLAALGAALVLGGAGATVIARRRRGRHASTSSWQARRARAGGPIYHLGIGPPASRVLSKMWSSR